MKVKKLLTNSLAFIFLIFISGMAFAQDTGTGAVKGDTPGSVLSGSNYIVQDAKISAIIGTEPVIVLKKNEFLNLNL